MDKLRIKSGFFRHGSKEAEKQRCMEAGKAGHSSGRSLPQPEKLKDSLHPYFRTSLRPSLYGYSLSFRAQSRNLFKFASATPIPLSKLEACPELPVVSLSNPVERVNSACPASKNKFHRRRRFNSFSLFTIHYSLPSAFTLVEVLIVIAILGILTAIVIPLYENNSQKAKESAAKENLRVLRNAIELYAAQHGGVAPGYYSDNPTSTLLTFYFKKQLTITERYLSKIPDNPLNTNNSALLKAVATTNSFPTEADDSTGWIYKPATKEIRLNSTGTDDKGVAYYNY